jgi:hypothetical protein
MGESKVFDRRFPFWINTHLFLPRVKRAGWNINEGDKQLEDSSDTLKIV